MSETTRYILVRVGWDDLDEECSCASDMETQLVEYWNDPEIRAADVTDIIAANPDLMGLLGGLAGR